MRLNVVGVQINCQPVTEETHGQRICPPSSDSQCVVLVKMILINRLLRAASTGASNKCSNNEGNKPQLKKKSFEEDTLNTEEGKRTARIEKTKTQTLKTTQGKKQRSTKLLCADERQTHRGRA